MRRSGASTSSWARSRDVRARAARLIDIPPLELAGLRGSLADLRRDAGDLPSPSELAALYAGLRRAASREGQPLLEVSTGVGLAFLVSARTLGRQHVLLPYREDWQPLRTEGFAAYARRVARPYGEAMAGHFDVARPSWTERALTRLRRWALAFHTVKRLVLALALLLCAVAPGPRAPQHRCPGVGPTCPPSTGAPIRRPPSASTSSTPSPPARPTASPSGPRDSSATPPQSTPGGGARIPRARRVSILHTFPAATPPSAATRPLARPAVHVRDRRQERLFARAAAARDRACVPPGGEGLPRLLRRANGPDRSRADLRRGGRGASRPVRYGHCLPRLVRRRATGTTSASSSRRTSSCTRSAPWTADRRRTAAASGHVCDGGTDLMTATLEDGQLETRVLDVGRNDYYGHGGSWDDVQDSRFLERLDSPDRTTPGGADAAGHYERPKRHGAPDVEGRHRRRRPRVVPRSTRDGVFAEEPCTRRDRRLRGPAREHERLCRRDRSTRSGRMSPRRCSLRFNAGLGVVDAGRQAACATPSSRPIRSPPSSCASSRNRVVVSWKAGDATAAAARLPRPRRHAKLTSTVKPLVTLDTREGCRANVCGSRRGRPGRQHRPGDDDPGTAACGSRARVWRPAECGTGAA